MWFGAIHQRSLVRWGGVNQKWTDDHGRWGGEGSAPSQNVHLWRFWANNLRLGLRWHPHISVHTRPDRKICCVSDVFCAIRAGRPGMGGCLPNGRCWTGGRVGGSKSQFFLGHLWWMTPFIIFIRNVQRLEEVVRDVPHSLKPNRGSVHDSQFDENIWNIFEPAHYSLIYTCLY